MLRASAQRYSLQRGCLAVLGLAAAQVPNGALPVSAVEQGALQGANSSPHLFPPYSAVVDGLKYSEDHEWVKVDGDIATVGITDHAQVPTGGG